MHLDVTDGGDGVSRVAMVGKLDVNGLHEIDLQFHAATAGIARPALVDLSGVEYIASLGIGLLISCAQSLRRKGEQMVLVNASPAADTVLRAAGIDQAIPMVADEAEGLRLLGQG